MTATFDRHARHTNLLIRKPVIVMNKIIRVLCAGMILSGVSSLANAEGGIHDKGSIYVFWGWNRSQYSESDIHFKGNGYDFTLSDVKASDRQTTVGIDPYFRPDGITLPQTNFKVGYFISDKYALSFGVDHMKYVMDQDQTVVINGEINIGSFQHTVIDPDTKVESEITANFDGTYNNATIDLSEEGFLNFEHTDGLNYLNFEISRFDELKKFNESLMITGITGVGIGLLMPRTNVTMLDKKRHDDFHFAGWGTSVKAGLELSYDRFFMRSELKYGYINMPDIRTTSSSIDKADQYFTFTELNMLFGYYF